MVVLSDESKKRKADDVHAADGDLEQRKKRKRTSHSKKKKQGGEIVCNSKDVVSLLS